MSIKSLILSFKNKTKAALFDNIVQYGLFNNAIEFTKLDECVIIKLNQPVHFLIDGTTELTINGELSVLANGDIHLDSRQLHLCSRLCKQLREMEDIMLEEALDEIGCINPEEQERKYLEFKNRLKDEIMSELRETI
jgi:hypothetical protein